ncbi:hypothetical protein NE237_029552 [Protea cynaroides]|uniref:Uncharacterized protein n=1 Tax=Protea cynaroides TaxID=273540 RepID=A0A9Q0GUH0_9MAGN|nr:hypothetical protein NE237_029552 [Protea cynaroides]
MYLGMSCSGIRAVLSLHCFCMFLWLIVQLFSSYLIFAQRKLPIFSILSSLNPKSTSRYTNVPSFSHPYHICHIIASNVCLTIRGPYPVVDSYWVHFWNVM